MAEIRRAQQLDPLSPIIRTDIGFQLFYACRYDEAIQQLKSILQMSPNFPLAHLWLARVYVHKGMYQDAVGEYNQAGKEFHDWVPAVGGLGYAQGKVGLRSEALKTLEELKRMSGKKYVTAYVVALVYAGLEGVEAWGLWTDGLWVEVLVVAETTALLPYTGWELALHFTPLKLLSLVLNIVVVWYLLARYLRKRRRRQGTGGRTTVP